MDKKNNFLNKVGEGIKPSQVLIIVFGLAIILILIGLINILEILNPTGKMVIEQKLSTVDTGETIISLSEDLSKEELYELVSCPCCGSPISKRCCGGAIQRISYIDELVDTGKSSDEVLLLVAKTYGMNSIIDSSIRQELRDGLIELAPENRPIITIEPAYFDFGDVSVAEGEVSTTMKVKNDGKTDLIISKMESSCGCTTAALIVNGVEGPRFRMPGHGKNPENWSATLAPNEEAELKIYYDPTVHPNLRGAVTRTVSVFSNDPVDFEVRVKIEVNQVD